MAAAMLKIGPDEYSQDDLKKTLRPQGLELTEIKFSSRFFKRFQFKAETIIDVGVHSGTPELYKAFSDREFLLVDPSPIVESGIKKRFGDRYNFRFAQVALGSERTQTKLRLTGGGSGLLKKADGSDDQDPRFQGFIDVDIMPLDDLLSTMQIRGPVGLKIDTEGYELEVLKGATETLKTAEFVIAELGVRKRFEGSYKFSDVITHLAKFDFELIAFLNERSGLQAFYDCLFVKSDHPLLAGAPTK